MTTVQLTLPTPHPAQATIITEAKRFNVLSCGRRFGKTTLGMDRLIHPALRGKPVAWFSPTYRLLSDAWRSLQSTLHPITVRKNESEHRMELRGGGVVEAWSLDNADAGRGRAYAAIVIDEAALVANLERGRGKSQFGSDAHGLQRRRVVPEHAEGERRTTSTRCTRRDTAC